MRGVGGGSLEHQLSFKNWKERGNLPCIYQCNQCCWSHGPNQHLKTMCSLLTLHPLSSPLKINVLCVYCMGVRSTRGRKKSCACAGKTCSLHFSAYDHLRLSAINLSTGLTKQHLGGETVRTQPHNIGFVCLFVWIVTKGTPKRKFSARTENWKITSENPNNKRGYKH